MAKRPNLGARLNSVAVHLGRGLRRRDGIGDQLAAEHRSALSVVTFDGPIRMSELAAREQVTAPAITRTVDILVRQKLVRRLRDPADGRAQMIAATVAGRHLVLRGRDKRTRRVVEGLGRLSPGAIRRIAAAIEDLEALTWILSEEEVAAASKDVTPPRASKKRKPRRTR
jgi:DNA-binding MarR family transcriptional regulator